MTTTSDAGHQKGSARAKGNSEVHAPRHSKRRAIPPMSLTASRRSIGKPNSDLEPLTFSSLSEVRKSSALNQWPTVQHFAHSQSRDTYSETRSSSSPDDPSASGDEDHHRSWLCHIFGEVEVKPIPRVWPIHDAPPHPGGLEVVPAD